MLYAPCGNKCWLNRYLLNKCINGNDSIPAVCAYSHALSHKLLELCQKKRERKGERRSKGSRGRGEVKRKGGEIWKEEEEREEKESEGRSQRWKEENNEKPFLSLSSNQMGCRNVTYLVTETQQILFYFI